MPPWRGSQPSLRMRKTGNEQMRCTDTRE
jgi:hypothetical protein